jgi:6-phosphogluconolactonase
MVLVLTHDVRIYPDVESLSRAAADSVAEKIAATLKGGNDRFCLAVAGGGTPRALYRHLAEDHRDTFAWDRLHLFWGDERYVPPEDAQSNYRMVQESLLSHVPIPSQNVHPMSTGFAAPEEAAQAYEKTLRTFFSGPWPRFDLTLLGLGADGHTASLFPYAPALEEQQRWVVPVQGPQEPKLRLTLTLPVLTCGSPIYFLVAGIDKAKALGRALSEKTNYRSCPAAAVGASHPAVVWWTDTAAARG